MTASPPTAPSSPAPSSPAQSREDRLRGVTFYQRKASPQEVEADFGMLRAHRAMAGPLGNVFLGSGIALIVLGLFGALVIGSANRNEPAAFFVPLGLGIALSIVPFTLNRRVSKVNDGKLDFASRFLRRLDLAPGSEVGFTLDLRTHRGAQVRSVDTGSSFWSGTSGEVNTYKDGWFSCEGELASGVAFRATRISWVLESVSRRSSGNRTTITTRTSNLFEDIVELRYDPARNPALAQAGNAAAAGIQSSPDSRVKAFQNQPGSLMLALGVGPRAQGDNHVMELAAALARTVALVDRSREVVLIDREASPPDGTAEAEMRKQGALGQLQFARQSLPSLRTVGVVALALAALIAGMASYKAVKRNGEEQFLADRAAADVTRMQGLLAKIPAKEKNRRIELEAMIESRARMKKEYEEAADAAVPRAIIGGVIALAALGGAGFVALRGRKKKAAASTSASATPQTA